MSSADHPFFRKLRVERLTAATFDDAIAPKADAGSGELIGVFFWGHDCPNCGVAKNMLAQDADDVLALGLKWYHVNAYEESELGTRFGLFGIPVFLFFHEGRKLGKITPFPGTEPFLTALRGLRAKYPARP